MAALRDLLRTSAYRLASRECVLAASRRRRLRGKTVVLMYHEVAQDDAGINAWTVVRESDFERQMDYVQSHFPVLRLEEALRRMGAGSVDEPACVITFDDGYSGNREVLLPFAEARGLPVAIFVATAAVAEQRLYWYDRLLIDWEARGPHHLDLRRHGLGVYAVNHGQGAAQYGEKERVLRALKALPPGERLAIVEEILSPAPAASLPGGRRIAPLTIDAVRELAASPRVTIGAHSHCHNILPQLPVDEMRDSIRRSKELLEQWTGRPVEDFSYPNGDHSQDVRRAVQQLGFRCSFTTSTRPWAAGEPLCTLPRIGVGRYDSLDLFKAKVSGAFRYARG